MHSSTSFVTWKGPKPAILGPRPSSKAGFPEVAHEDGTEAQAWFDFLDLGFYAFEGHCGL